VGATDSKEEKTKIKKALEKDNQDGARIHAQNAIRNETNAQNYLRLSSRVEGVASRLEGVTHCEEVEGLDSDGQRVHGFRHHRQHVIPARPQGQGGQGERRRQRAAASRGPQHQAAEGEKGGQAEQAAEGKCGSSSAVAPA
jgi:hypothetical protein